eukprot:gb/GEZN01009937.1/.p1 GENE.gb/GEZN01009937.1/~~gb/GEZN01009937.1/.p1  ORF type:complete len:384 (+),score=65.34 gb/GEZN01009937.1/:61-1152(+)
MRILSEEVVEDMVKIGGWELSESSAGVIAVLASIIGFGVYFAPLKTKKYESLRMSPVVTQAYINLAIFLSSFLVLTYTEFKFTYYGIIGAALWVPGSLLSLVAVEHCGLAVGMGVWNGTTILCAFFWGDVIFKEGTKNVPMAMVALLCLMIGVGCLAFSSSKTMKEIEAGRTGGIVPVAHPLDEPLLAGETGDTPEKSDGETSKTQKKPLMGVGIALIIGLLNGSCMAPLRAMPDDERGIVYLMSFGIGVLAVTPLFFGLWFLFIYLVSPPGTNVLPEWKLQQALLPGLLTGFIWSVANWSAVYGILYLGLALSFPLTNLCMVVSGLLGIVLYKEIAGLGPILVWTGGVVVMLVGALLLSIYG